MIVNTIKTRSYRVKIDIILKVDSYVAGRRWGPEMFRLFLRVSIEGVYHDTPYFIFSCNFRITPENLFSLPRLRKGSITLKKKRKK